MPEPTLIEKINRRGFIRAETGCLEYQGIRHQHGYGQICPGRGPIRVHRAILESLHGPVPDGLGVCHSCDNPPCCEPTYLLLGTQKDNAANRDSPGGHNNAGWTPCPNGHPYSADRPAKVDKNRCRECTRARGRRYEQRRGPRG